MWAIIGPPHSIPSVNQLYDKLFYSLTELCNSRTHLTIYHHLPPVTNRHCVLLFVSRQYGDDECQFGQLSVENRTFAVCFYFFTKWKNSVVMYWCGVALFDGRQSFITMRISMDLFSYFWQACDWLCNSYFQRCYREILLNIIVFCVF